jgi:glucose-1-phosphate thymidylyltransferase
MKALVLSGGMGTRLRPLTHSMAKQLVPIANKPVLVHCLEKIRDAGITQVGIIVGDRGEEIRRALELRPELRLELTYLPQEAPFGLAHCVLLARDFLGEDDFVMYLGDNIISGSLAELGAEFREHRPAAQLVVTPVDNPSESGVVELAPDGMVGAVVEKPEVPPSNLAITGVYFFSAAVHRAVDNITVGRRGEWEITDAVAWLIEQGLPVRAHLHTGFWKDTGRIQDVIDCNRFLLDQTVTRPDLAGEVDAASVITGPVVVEAGARVVRSRITGPAVIGAGTLVEDSDVGAHTALGRDCVLRHAGIEDSITLEGVSVIDVQGIHSSLIGRAAQVISAPDAGRHRLFVGDHTLVQVNR